MQDNVYILEIEWCPFADTETRYFSVPAKCPEDAIIKLTLRLKGGKDISSINIVGEDSYENFLEFIHIYETAIKSSDSILEEHYVKTR